MQRRFVVAGVIAVGLTAILLPGTGIGSAAAAAGRGAQTIPAGLARAIHARLGAAPVRPVSVAPAHPEFGFDVAVSADGTTALVGAPGAGKGKGAVYVYHVASAGAWNSSSTPVATLTPPAGHGRQAFGGWGMALSADGTTAFVGDPDDHAVYVFHATSENAWASSSKPTATLTATGSDVFGWSLATSADGTTVVVGDPWSAARVRVYHVASADAWASTSTPTATLSDSVNGLFLSFAVAMSADGTTVLTSDVGSTGGAAIFHVPDSSAWTSSTTPTAVLTNAGPGDHDSLGGAVGLSGDGTTAFVGESGVNRKGAVDVFHVAGEALWLSSSTPAAILTNGAGATNDYFGETLAASTDGKTVVVGAFGAERQKGATSTPAAELTDSAGVRQNVPVIQTVRGDFRSVSASVAIAADGATILFGAPWFNWRMGKAGVFHVADAGSWVTSSTPTAALPNSALPKPRCVVPQLVGSYVSSAKAELVNANCSLGKVKRVHSTKKNRHTVVSQSRAPGRNLPPGSKVNVQIGK